MDATERTYRIIVLAGDGIGPEVTSAARRVLDAAANRAGLRLDYVEELVGGAGVDAYGIALRPETLRMCKAADAVLFGSVGGPKWDDAAPQSKLRPGSALLGLRKGLGLFANLRPVRVDPAMLSSSVLRPERARDVDLLVVRELTGGLYFSKPKRRYETARGEAAVDTMRYSRPEIERVAIRAFELARSRRHKVCSVDKANVLESSRLWRSVVTDVAGRYPDVACSHLLVDAFAMDMLRRPQAFDVVVTENMFGDILTDEASMLAGALGMLPSASLGAGTLGLYEPIHGSAPDIAGKGIANPIGAILSSALLLRWSLGQEEAAQSIERAVSQVLAAGLRTADIAADGQSPVGTTPMADAIVSALR
ncbi:MAG TPA: 3-isopropylmalate dehydrogenase [Candidatus Dormibacteraeota bacterium]|nr:3-isopropylmalate dehydrogenase [Candidatus Dormibacteraeota bacterium]